VGVGGDGIFMVSSTTYPWRTSYRCATDFYISGAYKSRAPRICLPPFPENGPTDIRGAWKCGVPLISAICVAHSHIMHHGCGGLTPPAIVLVGAHICMAHPIFDAPSIRQDLWHIFLGAPRIIIHGASKRGAL
jgi:hypothetical protein